MPKSAVKRYTGAKSIPAGVQARTERRIQDHAAKEHPGKFIRVEVRFRGDFCYIDGFSEPDELDDTQRPAGETREQWIERLRNIPTHLCRLEWVGDEERWGFAFYTYAHNKYEPSMLTSGDFEGTPEEAFDTSTLWY